LYNNYISVNKRTGSGLETIINILQPHIRKIARDFGDDFYLSQQDLEQEARLEIVKKTRFYDKNRGNYSTFIWRCMKNRFKNLKIKLRKNIKTCALSNDIPIELNNSLRDVLGSDYELLVDKIVHRYSSEELQKKYFPGEKLKFVRGVVKEKMLKYREMFQ